VIGGYNPDQWEDTDDKKSSEGFSCSKDITSGSPFLFYWVNGQIQIIKHRDDAVPFMYSDEYYLMGFGKGLEIDTRQYGISKAYAYN
jgi:hypothetical protein